MVQSAEFNAGQGICERVTCSLDMADVGGELRDAVKMTSFTGRVTRG